MIYLFSQEYTSGIPFDGKITVEQGSHKSFISSRKEGVIAAYKTKDDCFKVMRLLRRQIRLGCREFVFPTQKELDLIKDGKDESVRKLYCENL